MAALLSGPQAVYASLTSEDQAYLSGMRELLYVATIDGMHKLYERLDRDGDLKIKLPILKKFIN